MIIKIVTLTRPCSGKLKHLGTEYIRILSTIMDLLNLVKILTSSVKESIYLMNKK